MNELQKIAPQDDALAYQPSTASDPMISMIERLVSNPDADLDKLERMLSLKKEHEANVAKRAADQAFAKASAEFPSIPLNGKNNHNGTRYAELKDIMTYTRPALSNHGFALSFSTEVTDRDVIVTAELAHEGGHTRRNSLPLPKDTGAGRNAVQAVGSTQTYGMRYTAQAILGLSLGEEEEDDGAAGRAAPPRQKDLWLQTVLQDLHPNADAREKAEAVANCLEAEWRRKTTAQQLANEWTRRAHLIEGDDGLEAKYPGLYANVLASYEARLQAIQGGAV